MKYTILSIAGYYCLAFVVFHLFFWKIFRWKADLKRLMPVNKAIMQVLNLHLTFVFLFIGFAIFLFTNELINTAFGNYILGAMAIFWFIRAIDQIIFFDRKN